MNRIILCILFSLSITAALSQKVYFIYVQTESDQPFYVKVNDKSYSSAGAGYLILSNLRDTSHNLRIGFPQNKSEYSFTINVDHKDHGYLLRNFGEKGWGLFDMQTLSVLYPVSMDVKTGTARRVDGKGGSAFTEWLALAIDDPSIKEKPVYAFEELKKSEVIVKEVARKEDAGSEKTSLEIAKTDAGKVEDQPKVDKSTANETSKKPDVVVDKIDAVIAKQETPKVDSVLNKDAGRKTDVVKVEAVKVDPIVDKEVQKKPDVFEEKTGASVAKSEPMRMDTVAVKDAGKKTDVFQQKTGAVVTKTEAVKEPAVVEKFNPSQVSKKAESSTTEGFGLVYVDQHTGGIDTIRILIPNGKDAVADMKHPENGNTETKVQDGTLKFLDFGDSAAVVKKQEPAGDKTQPLNAYITIETDKKNKDASENDSKETKPSNTYITIEKAPDNKKCLSVAGENDFFLLRKRMAAQKFEVDMLTQASRYFRTKCFTTYQLKNLSALFLTDAAKFRFFDASYAYVSDEANFKTLESELKDDYYITRFQGLIKQKF